MDDRMDVRKGQHGTIELSLSLDQLKRIYVALFCRLQTGGCNAYEDLDRDDLLSQLQSTLQQRATAEGVDCTDHAAWEAFLRITHPRSCPRRATTHNDQTGLPRN